MCLKSLLAVTPFEFQTDVIKRICKGEASKIEVQDASKEAKNELLVFQSMFELMEDRCRKLYRLVARNPLELEFFKNFGIDKDKLFVIDNFVQAIVATSVEISSISIAETFKTSQEFTEQLKSLSALKTKPTKETLALRFSLFIEEIYEVIRKSLNALFSLVERQKAKSKDSHSYIRS